MLDVDVEKFGITSLQLLSLTEAVKRGESITTCQQDEAEFIASETPGG